MSHRSLIFALLMLSLSVPASAQYTMQHSVFVKDSPAAALSAIAAESLPADQLNRVTIIPLRTLYTGVNGYPQSISYCAFYPSSVDRAAGDAQFDGANVPEPERTVIIGGCAHTLIGWSTRTFYTHAEAVSFYDGTGTGIYGHLTALQRTNAVLYSPPQPVSYDYVVLFQIEWVFC